MSSNIEVKHLSSKHAGIPITRTKINSPGCHRGIHISNTQLPSIVDDLLVIGFTADESSCPMDAHRKQLTIEIQKHLLKDATQVVDNSSHETCS